MIPSQLTAFRRDRFTWVAYLLLGYYAYYLNAPGVAMPLLRADLALSYTVGGLHVSALALGMVVAGLVTAPLVRRFGRRAIIWGGSSGMTLGALLFSVGRHSALTLPAIGFMGFAGTTLLATLQSSLSDHHGPYRALALTEANVIASATTIMAPLFVGGFARTGLGWRTAFVLPTLAWAILALRARSQQIPETAQDSSGAHPAASLPRVFWLYWLALVFGVAVEWSIISWGADFLVAAGALARADASLVMSAFFVAMLIGRALGTTLARRAEIVPRLLGAMVTGLAGFLIFWQLPHPVLRIGGLFIAGLGIANMFPYLLSIGMDVAGTNTDLGSARLTVGAGSAILLAPLTLGWIADRAGIASAYQLVAVLFGLAIAVVLLTRRLESRSGR
ncbi:MAG: MFS transporter [Anaerolineae bacterium]|nr:MFS transporter [Anaerolineae bacterium]